MENTLSKMMTICHENDELGNELSKKLYEEVNKIGVNELINKLKNAIKYAAAPEWVKKQFMNEKSYNLEIGSDGYIHKIEIIKKFVNEEDDNVYDNHYYIDAVVTPIFANIRGAEHYHEMPILVQIDDMEDFFGIKIF